MDRPPGAPAPRASFGQTLRAVGASFFGVRGSRAHQADLRSLNPVHVILAGIGMAGVFVLALVLIVRMVVR
ncbi:MAG: DUF2970 domain-containing protein [Betaproteobacteria bacterium]|nr:DUF2970 domain-containing protein [Betaproteobacteria bacterium]